MSKWYVWSRYVQLDGRMSQWCDVPKTYVSKRAAHRAVADRNAPNWEKTTLLIMNGARLQHIALPEGMRPRPDMLIRFKD